MDIAQGNDIGFTIELDPLAGDETQVTDFGQLQDLKVFIYTPGEIARFSKAVTAGFLPLTAISSTLLSGVIPASVTKLMEGSLKMDVYSSQIIPGGAGIAEQHVEAGVLTGLRIIKSIIKTEAS